MKKFFNLKKKRPNFDRMSSNNSKNKPNKKFNVYEVLESVPLLSGLTKDERNKLAKGLKKQEFKSGEYIMREGEDGEGGGGEVDKI